MVGVPVLCVGTYEFPGVKGVPVSIWRLEDRAGKPYWIVAEMELNGVDQWRVLWSAGPSKPELRRVYDLLSNEQVRRWRPEDVGRWYHLSTNKERGWILVASRIMSQSRPMLKWHFLKCDVSWEDRTVIVMTCTSELYPESSTFKTKSVVINL